MKLGHYVVIQQTRRRIPGRHECRLAYRSALDRQIHELLQHSEDAVEMRCKGWHTMYAITDELYQEIYGRTINDAVAGDNAVDKQDNKR